MIDGVAAANWLANYGAVPVGYCLRYVWLAYKAQGASTDMSAGTALEAWYQSDGKRPGDRNPPPGAAVWWGRRTDGNTDGDVTISLGGGRIAATDWPTGRTGITTLDQREAQIRREYLGWTSSIFDCPISLPGVGKDATPTPDPISSEEDTMRMLKINIGGTYHFASIVDGTFAGIIAEDDPAWMQANVTGPAVDVTERQLQTLLHKSGCATDCYRRAGTDMEVRHAVTGVWSKGGRWSLTDMVGALGKA